MAFTNEALTAIEAQQAEEKGRTAPWMVGEQLRDMVLREPDIAELVLKDLTDGGMSIQKAEKKIKAYADSHKTGNFACVTPAEAEKILREYFGLGEQGVKPALKTEGKVISLEDFF